ncbi:MAG: S41 family peptidase [Cyclobacteriaceae bacterium]
MIIRILKQLVILLLPLALVLEAEAQSCDCYEELIFAKEKIESNYAGFKDKVNETNRAAYEGFSDEIIKRAQSMEDRYACAALIRKWLAYFKDGHIQLNHDRPNLGDLSEDEIRTMFASTQSEKKWSEKKIKKYLDKKELHPIEGIWQNTSGSYRTAIIRSSNPNSTSDFMGIVLKADSVYWMPGHIKVEVTETDGKLMADYYYRDHHPELVEVSLYGDEVVEFAGISQWKKQYPAVKESAGMTVDPDYFAKNNQPVVPSFSKLDNLTALLTLPSFGGQHASVIDSLIYTHMTDITSSESLIIDLRGNPGGSDFCYAPIVPILYTHPIFTAGVSIYASEDNIRSWEVLLEDPKFSLVIKVRIRELVDKMKSNLNGYVEVPGEEVRHDTVYANPQKIGIIVDKSCASSTEQFILAAKQSDKVTVFGESTAGVLDYANMRSVDMKEIPYKLFYATSKSNRLPESPIDQIGISPDIELPYATDWIAEVKSRLKKLD